MACAAFMAALSLSPLSAVAGDSVDSGAGPSLVAPIPPEDPVAPLPAVAGGVAVELASLSTEPGSFELAPRLAISQRVLLKAPLFLGGDLILAPQTGTDSWLQGLVGVGFRQAFSHPYGGVESTQTRYQDSWTLGGGPDGIDDPVHAYEVVEGGQARGFTVDVRGVGLIAGPRLVVNGQAEQVVSVGAYGGLVAVYQRAPGWVEEPGEVGQRVRPETSWVIDAGALYHDGRVWGEIGLSGLGGPRIVGFARRNVYGRIGARATADQLEISLGIGSGVQINRAMEILPLEPEGL